MEDKKVEKLIEYIPGGMSEGMTIEDIAKKHKVESSVIKKQIKIGIPIEHEHSPDVKVATEICKDHLTETPYYYDYLEAMEKSFKENYKEDLDRGGMEDEEEEEKKGRKATEDDALTFLKKSPNPSDEDLHEWCKKQGIKVPTLEAQMYKLATKYVNSLDEEDKKMPESDKIEDAEAMRTATIKRLFG